MTGPATSGACALPTRPFLRCATVAVLVACSSVAWSQAPGLPCGSLQNGYGPYDYLAERDKLAVVETHHFTPEVETLVAGHTSQNVGGDLDYTLRAFPNHHRALLAMARLGERLRSPQAPGAGYPVECYFERALRFRPQDHTARLLYANYLFAQQREADALAQMNVVAGAAADNAFTHYNLGLIYLERKHYPEALAQAQQAYALGFTQPGLREQLRQAGQWLDTPAPAAAPASAPDH